MTDGVMASGNFLETLRTWGYAGIVREGNVTVVDLSGNSGLVTGEMPAFRYDIAWTTTPTQSTLDARSVRYFFWDMSNETNGIRGAIDLGFSARTRDTEAAGWFEGTSLPPYLVTDGRPGKGFRETLANLTMTNVPQEDLIRPQS